MRARAGDPDTWELIYRRVHPRLFAYARRRLATEEQAEEAVSETMVRAMGKIEAYVDSPARIDGWLFGIARNVILETYRASNRHASIDPGRLNEAPDLAADPMSVVIAREEYDVLAQAFARLSPQDREVLEMRVVVGLDAAQVAALTGRRPGAVRTAQSRALQRLRLEFEGLMA